MKLPSQKGAKIRILVHESSNGYGGSAVSIFQLIQTLNGCGFEFVLVHNRPDGRFERFDEHCERIYLPSWHARNRQQRSLAMHSNIPALLEALRLASIIIRKRVDLVHLNNSLESNLAGALASVLTGRPVIAHERGVPRRFSKLVRRLCWFVSTFLAVSHASRDALMAQGVPSEHVRILYDGIDVRRIHKLSPEAGRDLRAELGWHYPVVVLVGTVTPWKGQHILAKAADIVLRSVPGCHFVLVGECESEQYLQEIESILDRLGIRRAFSFLGFRSDAVKLMQIADVVVHSSIDPEPFGLVVLESQALGCPTIATIPGGPAEIVRHGHTGLLVQAGDPAELAGAICRLLTDSKLRANMGKQAELETALRFDHDYSARQLAISYLESLGRDQLNCPPVARDKSI